MSRILALACLLWLSATAAGAQMRSNILDPSYRHDRFGTQPQDIVREFRGFTVSFDSDDDDDDDGEPDTLGIPHWVSHEIRRSDGSPESRARPSKWFTDDELHSLGVAPTDDTYHYTKAFRDRHPNWYDRGHMAQKYLIERLGADAGWNTHTVLNAVPQRSKFNSGIWLDMECRTGAWANKYGAVWVITGPVFLTGKPTNWIGESAKGEMLVAVPDALFKIVIREVPEAPGYAVLAFIYPQEHEHYAHKPYDHLEWATTVNRIEKLTGLNFLTSLPPETERRLEARKAKVLWPHAKSDFDTGCQTQASDQP